MYKREETQDILQINRRHIVLLLPKHLCTLSFLSTISKQNKSKWKEHFYFAVVSNITTTTTQICYIYLFKFKILYQISFVLFLPLRLCIFVSFNHNDTFLSVLGMLNRLTPLHILCQDFCINGLFSVQSSYCCCPVLCLL